MRILVLVAILSALTGGVAGASVALWAAPDSTKKTSKTTSSRSADPDRTSTDGTVEERLANIEQALRVLERRGSSPLRPLPQPGAANAPSRGAPADEAPAVVDDPVFEAAVRDIIERAEVDRENEREVRRSDRRKQMATRWADDVAPRLGLNEQQKGKMLEVAQEFMEQLGRLWERDGGARGSRTERRAEMQRLREQSEQKLRTVLDPGQMRSYEALPDEEKLGFPRRRDGEIDRQRRDANP